LHRQIKKVSKNKSSLLNEQALTKPVYLAVREADKMDPATQGLAYDILTIDDLL